jgi:UDP-N-acetylglucosamine--N-acetylmuramyl-(pentapeptide) pyrophosphoryl-undecaprenol N-acetylglucosamine transferase
MMKRNVEEIVRRGDVQVIWQTGKFYAAEMDAFMNDKSSEGVWRGAFIERMDLAYAAADLVISRSGAGTVSELSLVGKPVLFVPSPGVAEDHQTKNAMALVAKGAAAVCPDPEAAGRAMGMAMELLSDPARLAGLSTRIGALGTADSAERIAEIILNLKR